MVGFPTAGRFRELLAKYGKVAIAVHLSVSGVSITGLYFAIKNNMDVEGALQRLGLLGKDVEEAMHHKVDEVRLDPTYDHGPAAEKYVHKADHDDNSSSSNKNDDDNNNNNNNNENNNNKALISGGSALVLALLCNKALLPVRIPLTVALTPPVARFLARRKLYNAGHPMQ